MNFDQEFISRYGISGLRTGRPWDQQISLALKESGAVLMCLSRHFKSHREIAQNETVFASISNKLVACIIDDLPFGEIEEFGLAQLSKIQTERIDTTELAVAIEFIERSGMHSIESLPERARLQWRIILKLKSDIDQILIENGNWVPSKSDVDLAIKCIEAVPIYPTIQTSELPAIVVDKFAEKFDSTKAAYSYINQAMDILWETNDNQFTAEQLLLRRGELPNLEVVGATSFWTDALLIAAQKSRRTLAALALMAGSPINDPADNEDNLRQQPDDVNAFLANLQRLDL